MMKPLLMLWPPHRARIKREAGAAAFFAQQDESRAALAQAGWTHWLYAQPRPSELVEMVRLKDYSDAGYKPTYGRAEDLPEWLNVADLYWRRIDGPVIEARRLERVDG